MQENGKKIGVGEGKERFFYFAFRAELLTLELLKSTVQSAEHLLLLWNTCAIIVFIYAFWSARYVYKCSFPLDNRYISHDPSLFHFPLPVFLSLYISYVHQRILSALLKKPAATRLKNVLT